MANDNQAQGSKPLNAHINTALTLNRPRAAVYAALRKFENMPRYVQYLNKVTILDEKTSEWEAKTAKNIYKAKVVIIDEQPGNMIRLQAFIDGELKGECVLTFTDKDANATQIDAEIYYHNKLGSVANLFGPLVEGALKGPKREFVQAVEADL